ncbi:hypothetical protein BG006_010629 [Podila minutissima]|uniref:Uncharacterized protein n=1 Tax=Podila minutissima TaxID=64525 RepID=A0A9P5SGY9_9FUNG|nr:hypothetical protein BG006_010629 [Podila minutissima]
MPVTLEDPFQLASFSSTTHHHQHHQAVSCSPEKEFRSTEGGEDNLLVVAVQGEGVQLFNTADQKCILSYSSPPGYSFAGSAQTLHKATHRNIYAVVAKGTDIPTKEEGKLIWMWKDETSSDKDIDMSEDAVVKPSTARKNVQKFDRKIHQLFVSSLLPNHVVLANTDGSLSLVTEDLKRVVNTKDQPTPAPKSKKDKNSKPVIVNTTWATTFNTTGSWIPVSALACNTLIILTVTESSADKIAVTFSYVNEEHRGFSTFGHVDIMTGGAQGFAFDVKSGQFSFMTAGQLKVYQFAVSQGDHIVSATESLTLPLPGYVLSSTATPSKKGAKAASETDARIQRTDSIALGDNYLAVAGNHKTGDKSELTLTVWDVKYGTLQAKHVIPGNFNAQDTTCSLTVLPDSVLVLTISTLVGTSIKSDIYLCPFYSEPMSLLGAMGRMKDTAPFIGLQGPALSQDAYTTTTTALLAPSNVGGTVKASALAASHLNKQVDLAQKIEQETLKKLSSESATPTVAVFEKVFFANIERLSQEAIDDMMARYGVDQEKARNAANNVEESKPQAMEVDSVPVKTAEDDSSKKKSKKKAAKAAAKAAAAAAKEAEKAKEPVDGSSSESSSDEDDDGDEEKVIMLSSDEENDEAEGDKELEDEEYKQREEQERARLEAHMEKMKGWLKTEEEAVKNQKLHRREQRVARKATPRPELSHHFLTTVVGRCFRRLPNGQPDMTFWPEMVVRYLIFNQLVGNSNPGAGQSGIALELMEREQWSLIELALQKLHDIPELDMITMLKQVIGLNKNKHNNSTSSETTTTTSHSSTSTASSLPSSTSSASTSTSSSSSVPDIPHFLHLIMAAPRNEVFMQQALKRLNVEELSIVLEILKDWICSWSELGGIGHSKHGSVKLPNYSLMVDFTTVLMDVHFPSLIMSPHLHPVLKAIQGSIQKETEVSNQLEQTLRGPLGLFDRKHKDMVRRKKAARLNGSVPAGGLMAEKKKKREGDTVASDYVVEIIHL